MQDCLLPCDPLSFCDYVSKACQSCWDVCDPLRKTPYLCRQHSECAGFWTETTRPRTTLTGSDPTDIEPEVQVSPTVSANVDWVINISGLQLILVGLTFLLLTLLLIVVFWYCRRHLPSIIKTAWVTCLSRCIRSPSHVGRGLVATPTDAEVGSPPTTVGVQETGCDVVGQSTPLMCV